MKEFIETKVGEKIESITNDLFERFNRVTDEGRTNELKNYVRINLRKMAARIDRGVDFETRMESLPPPKDPKPEAPDQQPEDQETQEMRENLKVIQTAYQNQRHFLREGEPILPLPEPNNDKSSESK